MFRSVLSKNAQIALGVLGKSGIVKEGYLAGGSALALRLGHRISVDFDFFSPREFDSLTMSNILVSLGIFTVDTREKNTLLGIFNGVKYSYFYYPYPLLEHGDMYEGVTIASATDIAVMKLSAIMDRGIKRDFIDLYMITKQGVLMDALFLLYDQKYGLLQSNKVSLLKSLSYFDDADKSDMPEMLIPISWEEVKQFFASESVRLGKKYLEGKDESRTLLSSYIRKRWGKGKNETSS